MGRMKEKPKRVRVGGNWVAWYTVWNKYTDAVITHGTIDQVAKVLECKPQSIQAAASRTRSGKANTSKYEVLVETIKKEEVAYLFEEQHEVPTKYHRSNNIKKKKTVSL